MSFRHFVHHLFTNLIVIIAIVIVIIHIIILLFGSLDEILWQRVLDETNIGKKSIERGKSDDYRKNKMEIYLTFANKKNRGMKMEIKLQENLSYKY